MFTGDWWFKTLVLANNENDQVTLTKTGTWTWNNGTAKQYYFRCGSGKNSKASFTNESGGTMNCNNTNVIARGSGSIGIAEINGGTYNGNSKPFYVAKGTNSTGRVVVNGGTLKIADVHLGNDNGANASVIVSNGTLNVTGHFRLGYKAGGVTTNYLEVAGGTFTQSASKNVYVGARSFAFPRSRNRSLCSLADERDHPNCTIPLFADVPTQ